MPPKAPEVVDAKTNKVSVKIPDGVLGEMKDEQYRIRKQGSPEPTYSQLIEKAWAAYKSGSRHEPGTTQAIEGSTTSAVQPKPSSQALADGLRIIAGKLESIGKQATDAASGIQALISVQPAEGPKVSKRKSNPAVKAARLVRRSSERGSGTEGL